jgi:hypothetical protein
VVVVMVGAEGGGLSRLVHQTYDQIVSIPIADTVESLNAVSPLRSCCTPSRRHDCRRPDHRDASPGRSPGLAELLAPSSGEKGGELMLVRSLATTADDRSVAS